MRLTVARVFDDPALDGTLPVDPRFSPDGRRVAYLATAEDDRRRLDLYLHVIGERRAERLVDARTLVPEPGALTGEEKQQRERRRRFTHGVSHYAWHPDGETLLVLADGAVWLADVDGGVPRRVTAPGCRQTDVAFSPAGAYLSYVRDGDLYVYALAEERERRLTSDAGATVTNGLADFIAQEEMHRFEGYWWSADDTLLAFTRVDSAPVPETLRYEIEADDFRVLRQRYPYAGGPNAEVTLMVVSPAGGATPRLIDYLRRPDDYLARAGFAPDGRLAVQVQSRDQQRLDLFLIDPRGCAPAEHVLTETASSWIDLHDNLVFLPDGMLWTSARDGHEHLYLYRGGTPRALTSGEGRVNAIAGHDRDRAYVLGWFDSPTEQHLYAVGLEDGARTRLTEAPGWHEVAMDRDGKAYLDRFSSLGRPPCLELVAGGERVPLVANDIDEGHPYAPYLAGRRTPTLGTIESEDGQLLHYRLTLPERSGADDRLPVLVHVYGGPGVQRVRNEWTAATIQLLAQHGFAVFELDNRGSGNRGTAFQGAIHGRLGDVEVRDQLRGLEFLAGQPWTDPSRIGVFGHSYGGYLALMCLATAPDAFKAGVAIAPVTDWRVYDTHYTERYLGMPAANDAGYRASNVLTHAADIRAPLLVMHGMADDNVLFTHATKLFKHLQDANVAFEMMTYPGAKHALHERPVAIHRYHTMIGFLTRHLEGR